MQAFEAAAVRQFENEVLASAHRLVPAHAAFVGDERLREVARLGLQRAERYGFTNRGPARFYVDLMLLFGSDFDTDPQFPWAAQALTDTAASDQMVRAERLWAGAQDFLDRADGPNGEFTLDALRRVRRRIDKARNEPPADQAGVLIELEQLHPHRWHAIGEPAGRAVVARAAELAQPYASEAGALLLFATLVFLLGHGVAGDPQFPWVAAALAKEPRATPAEVIEEVRSAWAAYLAHVVL